MARKRSAVADFAVYLAVRVGVCLLQMLSYRAGRAVAGWLAWLAYHVDRRHRLAASDNLRHAFGDQLDEAGRDELVRGVYRHFCTLLVTMTHLPRKLHPNNWKDYLEMDGGRRLVDGLLSGRPLLLVTGHFGNWELGGYALGLFGFTTHAIARPLDNPFLERFLKRFRERTGQKVLAKKGDFDRMEGLLAGGGVMATLGDQDAGPRGLFVDFFGRPASTHKAIAVFAVQYRVPMVVVGVAAVGGPMRHRLSVEDVIDPGEYDSHPDPFRAITQRFTAALERLARRHPEQYFWLHRRWKHQPKARRAA
jgi:Kdo2-lipid IVA lauroyltransferase/acyltransferase